MREYIYCIYRTFSCMNHFSFKNVYAMVSMIAESFNIVCCVRDLELTKHFILGQPTSCSLKCQPKKLCSRLACNISYISAIRRVQGFLASF